MDPNLLLILDNSASMNDLAYVGSQGTCYDDTYSSTETYAGYFENGTWYSYSRPTPDSNRRRQTLAVPTRIGRTVRSAFP